MSRIQLALNVSDLEASVAFYSTLFGTEPHKRRPGYANFAVTEPPSSSCSSRWARRRADTGPRGR